MLWAEIRVSNACEKGFFKEKFVAGHSKWFLKNFHIIVSVLN